MLLKRTVDGKRQRGWAWSFPGTDRSVFSYPEIVFGWKPLDGRDDTIPGTFSWATPADFGFWLRFRCGPMLT